MSRRRWVAVAIAVGLFLVSGVASLISSSNQPQEKTSSLRGINALLYGTNEMTEVSLVEGNMNQRIAHLSLEGTISSESSGGLFSSEEYNQQFFISQLQAIEEDETVAAVLLEVNSPGGGVYESAEIAREMKKIKELGVPVYVSMKNTAASGGYYISAGADKIFATEETVTGSIGVIMSGVNYSGLFEKLGIADETYKSGALKDMGSSSRPATEEDKKVLQEFVDSAYQRFVKIVAEGRGMSEEEVRKLADGRIYDGSQALENGLIDEIGFPDDALEALRNDYQLQDAEVFEYGLSSSGFASTWLGAKIAEWQGLKASPSERMLEAVESLGSASAPKPLYYYGGE